MRGDLRPARFAGCWRRLGARDDGATTFARLAAAYAEPHRAYHTVSHIDACLALFDEVGAEAERPDEIEAALWFHDAVYDTRAQDNEERSAELAAALMAGSGIPEAVAARVADMVRSTKAHDAATADGALLVDIDLSILAAAPDELARFEAGVRREYAWVDERLYRAGRVAVLQRFLDRPAIYRTPALHARLEALARENLKRLVTALR